MMNYELGQSRQVGVAVLFSQGRKISGHQPNNFNSVNVSAVAAQSQPLPNDQRQRAA
jgi:hypothetical protein